MPGMSSTDTTTLSRWRPAIVGLSLAAGVLGIYYARQADNEREETSQQRLHRSNAIRRRSPRLRHARPSIAQTAQDHVADDVTVHATTEGAGARRESFAGTLELADDDATVNAGDPSDGQSLLNMLYNIAVEQANREGYVHRGVTCNACNAMPIRGVRYRCANCPDYDLCEQCEGQGSSHDRTHLFYKIRIPAPFLGANPRQQQPVWYPGKPHVNTNGIPHDLKKQLSEATGLERSLIDALWDQFRTLAGFDWPEDPTGLCVAIDRSIWAKYCVPPLMKNHTPAMALLFDRSLAFWDENGDGLIGFAEFLNGLAVRQSRNRKERYKRTFRAHDLDKDGYVMRKDFMDLFVAHYAYSKELSKDMAMFIEDEVLEGGQLKETMESTQPVSSCFHGSIPSPGSPRTGEGKTMSSLGDMVLTDGGGLLRAEEDGLVNVRHDSVAAPTQNQEAVIAKISDSVSQGFADSEWPPEHVTPEDAHDVLGKRTSLREITEISDQRRVLDAANRRVQHLSSQVPNGARTPLEAANTPQIRTEDDETNGDNSSGELVLDTPNSEFLDSGLPLTPAVTEEFLFQKSAEGLQELLDPMFKQLEDLHSYYARSESERMRLKTELDKYKLVRGNVQLCESWLRKTLYSWRQGDLRKGWDYGDDMAHEIVARLQQETEVGSNEWMSNVKERIIARFTNEADEKAFVEKLQALPGEENQEKARQIRRLALNVRSGDEPLEDSDDSLSEPLASKTNVVVVDENTVMELLGEPALAELQAARAVFDDGSGVASEIDSRPVAELLEQAGYEAVSSPSEAAEANSNDNTPDITRPRLDLTNADLEDLFVSEVETPDMMEVEPFQDCTLPQHRPDHADESVGDIPVQAVQNQARAQKYARWSSVFEKGTLASMELADPFEDRDSDYFQVKLKYLTILELYAESAAQRGGWARLNVDEFEEVMSGSKGPSLYPIGQWLDLASF